MCNQEIGVKAKSAPLVAYKEVSLLHRRAEKADDPP